MAYYLGIDGGGTKTRAVLADETTILAKAMTGGSNLVRLGETQARDSLHAAIRQVCAAASVFPSQISHICIGAAGAARPAIAARIRQLISELIPDLIENNIQIVGDTDITLEAAFGADPGVIAIAGTGSIVYGRSADGRIVRAGGWGYAVSDEGSGHWIGRSALSAVLRVHDQGLETTLTARIMEAWRITTLDELVQRANATPPPEFPRLFPVVLRAADEGDNTARELLHDAGTKLAGLAVAVVGRLSNGAGRVLPVAMTGSVFRQSADVRRIFNDKLQANFPGIAVRHDLVDPVDGALAKARRM